MKKIFLFYFIPLFAISLIASGYNMIGDDPNLDQAPRQYWDHVSGSMPGEIAVITDNAGFDNFDLGIDFAEAHISSSPKNPNWYFLAYNTNATYYTLNGLDWQRNNPLFPNQSGDPITAYDSLGNLYYDNMKSPITGTWNIKSTNGGVSWLTPVSANIGNDKNWIAADQSAGPYSNYIYGVMTPGNVVRSTDGGATYNFVFSASNNLPGMMVAVGANTIGGNVPGGCVYVVTNTGNSFAATYTFFRSTNGGATFDFMSAQSFANYVGSNVGGRNSVHNMRTRPYPFITADNSYGPNRGRLYLIYASNTPVGDGNKPDIFSRFSTDHGATWSAAVRVNDDPNTENHNQWHPATWCDKETGRLYVQWMDTRDTPTGDSALIYASYSTNGGVSFVPNKMLSNKKFRIDCASCGGGGTPRYLGDYNAVTSNSVTSMSAWTDFRNNNFGSYVAYYPDFALKTSSPSVSVNSGQNATFRAIVPAIKDYASSVKFTATIDTLPASGSLNISFVGRDSITSYPDSVSINVAAVGSVTPGRYRLKVIGKGPNGTPIHSRYVDVLVNSSYLTVGTNRPGIADFSVNGIVYNQTQQLVFENGSNVTVRAISPRVIGSTQYVFTNWSNSGDTTQVITVNSNTSLTAFYKTQYRILISSSVGNTFGGGLYYDSASSAQIGVLSRVINSGGTNYYFRGWTGVGPGAYTSPDSTGLDSIINLDVIGPIVETARWTTTVGINQLSSLIPDQYSLYQNYPNPFNPVTNIKFDIIKTGGVKIVVYNALGKEVNVLLNENLSPGSYKVDFNGSGYASGIYYYKIVTSDFTDVKKMLLIK
ncbi:MAG: T9SS type A sorting domain-containing protein [Ignavibacteria bacterium]|nr:T9SS type A sorting domain-containing protein [Ignavibacteria bacterium]